MALGCFGFLVTDDSRMTDQELQAQERTEHLPVSLYSALPHQCSSLVPLNAEGRRCSSRKRGGGAFGICRRALGHFGAIATRAPHWQKREKRERSAMKRPFVLQVRQLVQEGRRSRPARAPRALRAKGGHGRWSSIAIAESCASAARRVAVLEGGFRGWEALEYPAGAST